MSVEHWGYQPSQMRELHAPPAVSARSCDLADAHSIERSVCAKLSTLSTGFHADNYLVLIDTAGDPTIR
jgi:hypothetical protein